MQGFGNDRDEKEKGMDKTIAVLGTGAIGSSTARILQGPAWT